MSSLLHIANSTITDLAAHCPLLEYLDVSYTRVRPTALYDVAVRCPLLTTLLISARQINQTLLDSMATHCNHLQNLMVYSHGPFNFQFSSWPHLVNVTISGRINNYNIALLQLVTTCKKLQTLSIYDYLSICNDTRIVDTMDRNCPQLSSVQLGWCSQRVHRALVNLRAKREKEKMVFYFRATLVRHCKGFGCVCYLA